MRLLCCFGALLLAAGTKAAPGPVEIGPFRVGMTLDEVRAAAPSVRWQEQNSQYGRSLKADDALELGGASYSITIRPDNDGSYSILASRDERNETLETCRSHLAGLITEFEPKYGRFAFSPGHWNWPRPGDTAMTRTKIGERSELGMRSYGTEENPGLSFATALARPPRDTLVEVEGVYVSGAIPGCIAQLRIVRDPKHRYH